MTEDVSGSNQLTMKIILLNTLASKFKDEVKKINIEKAEQGWKQLLSNFHECVEYAQSNRINLQSYKAELTEIVNNLYEIQRIIHDRTYSKTFIPDNFVHELLFIADKIDDVLVSIGCTKVVRPITEAIFEIPRKIISMISSTSDTTKILPSTSQHYLPPPLTSLPSSNGTQPDTASNVDDIIEWVDVKDTNESFSSQVLRQMRNKILHIKSGDE
jgi:hypothetical protein